MAKIVHIIAKPPVNKYQGVFTANVKCIPPFTSLFTTTQAWFESQKAWLCPYAAFLILQDLFQVCCTHLFYCIPLSLDHIGQLLSTSVPWIYACISSTPCTTTPCCTVLW